MAAALGAGLTATACKCGGPQAVGPAGSASAGSLPPELAAKVLARVGDREITLGDFAAAFARMDRFERLRYETPERRKQLLQELINAELLAAEARRRGLDKDPAVRARIRQALRDELLADLRRTAPGPEDVPAAEVRAYYDGHKGDFVTPERRRLSAIVTGDRAAAERALTEAKAGSPDQWGELVKRYSQPPAPASGATELDGDLGFVTAPDDPRGEASEVPAAVRRAGFAIPSPGAVHDSVVEADGRYYVLRLMTRNEAGQRGFTEAERSIRVTLAQQKLREAEARLEAELRKKHGVAIDEAALSEVRSPAEGRD